MGLTEIVLPDPSWILVRSILAKDAILLFDLIGCPDLPLFQKRSFIHLGRASSPQGK
jgi:hypothetical protein